MLNLHFHPESKVSALEVTIDPPYDLVGIFLTTEGETAAGTRYLVAELRALGGDCSKHWSGGGNALTIHANGETTKLITQWEEPERTCALPTEWLIDALERYAAFCNGRSRQA
ncbi:MAG: hypothetical protein FWD73_11260 [Polyangiaceae bacterium]|nr:hypothetical protein [Polyangiaceae bacterium]